jgi:ribosomal protein S6
MAKEATKYEAMYILDPGLSEEEIAVVEDRLREGIEGQGAEFQSIQEFGRRRMTYEINGHREGLYKVMYFRGGGEAVAEIKHEFLLSEEVIRGLVVVANPRSLVGPKIIPATPPPPEGAVAEEAPVEDAAAEEAVVEEVPVEEVATEEPVVEEAPAEEVVAEAPVVEEAPAEEADAEAPVVEEAPAEETAAEAPVVEEASAEEAAPAEPVAEEAPAAEVAAEEPAKKAE